MEEENKFFFTDRKITALEKENKVAGLLKKLIESESIFREKTMLFMEKSTENFWNVKENVGGMMRNI